MIMLSGFYPERTSLNMSTAKETTNTNERTGPDQREPRKGSRFERVFREECRKLKEKSNAGRHIS